MVHAQFRRAAQGEPRHYEVGIRHRDGHRVDLRLVNIPIVVADEVVGVYGIAEDVTERKRVRPRAPRGCFAS